MSKIFEIIKTGNLEDLKKHIIENPYSIHEKYEQEFTVIHYAAMDQKNEILEYILQQGKINVNSTDNKGNTALHWAALRNNRDIISILIRYNININLKNNSDYTAIGVSISGNMIESSEFLIEHDANIEDRYDGGNNIFHTVASNGLVEMLECLYRKIGPKKALSMIDAKNDFEYTPIMMAAIGKNPAIIKNFHSKGANIFSITKQKSSLLDLLNQNIACKDNNIILDVKEYVEQCYKNQTIYSILTYADRVNAERNRQSYNYR